MTPTQIPPQSPSQTPSRDLAPYERALAEHVCRPCAERDVSGRCCRGPGDPCVLRAHTSVLVETVTRLGRRATPDEIGTALGRRICTVCAADAKGYCSLDELLIDAPQQYLEKVVETILGADGAPGTPPA